MTKTTSIVLTVILSLLIVFVGVFSFLPETPVGDYNIYYSPANLIQIGADLGDSEQANYVIDTSELVDFDKDDIANEIVTILNSRLGTLYTYYNNDIVVDEETKHLTVTIPVTTAHDETTAKSRLESLAAVGKIEILDTTEYESAQKLMSNDGDVQYFKSAKVTQMSSAGREHYIVEARLTAEGVEIANDSLMHSTSQNSGYCSIDGVVTSAVSHQFASSKVQIYLSTLHDAELMASYINFGVLPATLEFVDANTVANESGLLMYVGIAFGVLVLALALLMIAKYKWLGVACAMTMILTAVLVTIFAGLAYFSVLNIYAIIGFVLGLALLAYCMMYNMNKVMQYAHMTANVATGQATRKTWLRLIIVCLATMVVGIIMWVIPTAFTIGLGNALVYGAVATLVAVFGINRVFLAVVGALATTHQGNKDAKAK